MMAKISVLALVVSERTSFRSRVVINTVNLFVHETVDFDSGIEDSGAGVTSYRTMLSGTIEIDNIQ